MLKFFKMTFYKKYDIIMEIEKINCYNNKCKISLDLVFICEKKIFFLIILVEMIIFYS